MLASKRMTGRGRATRAGAGGLDRLPRDRKNRSLRIRTSFASLRVLRGQSRLVVGKPFMSFADESYRFPSPTLCDTVRGWFTRISRSRSKTFRPGSWRSGTLFDVPAKLARRLELEAKTGEPGFWDNQEAA